MGLVEESIKLWLAPTAGDFLYALGAKARSVNVLELTGPGKAKQIQTFVVTDAVPDLPISVQGMAVFVK